MPDPTWLDYTTAIGAITTPVLVIVLAAVSWKIRRRLERRIELEDKLREDRIQVYNHILEPLILLFTSQAAWVTDPKNKNRDKDQIALQKLLSVEYRQQAFRMSLVGSDEVVLAYNEFLQFFYGRDPDSRAQEAETVQMLSLVGTFLLEVRRSMGNDATKLDNWDMLEWFITDARKHRPSKRWRS